MKKILDEVVKKFIKEINLPPKNLYKNLIGQWSTTLDIIYTDQKKGIQSFDHVYEFLEPSYISHDQTVIFGRIKRLSDPNTAKIIQIANNEYDKNNPPKGFYNIHTYYLRWDSVTNRYIGKKIDVDDATFADFFYSGEDKLSIFSHEVSESKTSIDNAHVAYLRLYKMDNKINIPSYEEIYNKKINNINPTDYNKKFGNALTWEKPLEQVISEENKDKKLNNNSEILTLIARLLSVILRK